MTERGFGLWWIRRILLQIEHDCTSKSMEFSPVNARAIIVGYFAVIGETVAEALTRVGFGVVQAGALNLNACQYGVARLKGGAVIELFGMSTGRRPPNRLA